MFSPVFLPFYPVSLDRPRASQPRHPWHFGVHGFAVEAAFARPDGCSVASWTPPSPDASSPLVTTKSTSRHCQGGSPQVSPQGHGSPRREPLASITSSCLWLLIPETEGHKPLAWRRARAGTGMTSPVGVWRGSRSQRAPTTLFSSPLGTAGGAPHGGRGGASDPPKACP